MRKLELKKLAGVSVLSLGLVLGMAGFAGASSGTIDTTGPNSDNEISHESSVDLDVENNNRLNLRNRTEQRATSGDALVRYNTTGGDAETGSVSNDNMVDAWIEVDNSQAVGDLGGLVDGGGLGSNEGSIENTGPGSDNEVTFESEMNVDIENNNDVQIENSVEQSASSGDATVRYNTTGGSAVTGDVSNTSSSVFTISVSN